MHPSSTVSQVLQKYFLNSTISLLMPFIKHGFNSLLFVSIISISHIHVAIYMTSSVYCQENFQVTFIALFIGHNYNNIISLYRIHNLNSTIYIYINHAIVVTKKK